MLKYNVREGKKEIMQRYYNLVAIDSEKARCEILKLDYKKDGYLLSRIALTFKDEALFFKNGNQRKKSIKDKLLIAKKYIDKAIKLSPDCRDILYTKGTIYIALHEKFEAMDCYIKIIENGESLTQKFNCSNYDAPYVRMIINDAHFQLYRLFYDLENFKMANKFLKEYKGC